MNASISFIEKSFLKSFESSPSLSIRTDDTAKVLKEHANLLENPLIEFLTVIKPTYLILLIKGSIFTQVKIKKVVGGFEHSGLFALIDKMEISLQK
jgi:protein SCO1/2